MFLREEIQFCEISFFSPSRFWLKNIKIKIWKFEISETRFQSMDKENLPPDYREQVSDLTWPLSDPKWPKMTWNDLITWQFYIGWRSAEFTCSKFWGTVQNPHELSRTANKWKVSHQMRHGDDSYIMSNKWTVWVIENLSPLFGRIPPMTFSTASPYQHMACGTCLNPLSR